MKISFGVKNPEELLKIVESQYNVINGILDLLELVDKRLQAIENKVFPGTNSND